MWYDPIRFGPMRCGMICLDKLRMGYGLMGLGEVRLGMVVFGKDEEW